MINTDYIVLVDDTDELKEFMERLFKKESNYDFICSSSEKAVIKKSLAAVPDLIVINEDGLNDTNVVSLSKYIKKNKETIITPIVVISKTKDADHRLEVLKAGAEYYIVKPLNEECFFYTIKNLSHLISANRCISELTGLPGNVQIENELKRRIASKKLYAILYVDLDNFKAYNDKYGFMNGDEVIKFTANTISSSIQQFGKRGDFLGHIGGDDFVAVVDFENSKKIGRNIIKEFDKKISTFYTDDDVKAGNIKIANRKGKMEKYPIMSITVAMISNRYKRYNSTLEIGEEGASVKKKAKTIPGSTFLEDRRRT